MRISFFEEFPSPNNLEKLDLLDSNPRVFLGAMSVSEFQRLSSDYPESDFVYWPILDRNDGYWVSPFSRRRALLNLFESLKGKRIPVMLDMELPRRRPMLLTQMFDAFANHSSIDDFIANYKGEVYTAEYLFEPFFMPFMYKDPRVHNNNVIKMVYTSMHNYDKEKLSNRLKEYATKYGPKFLVGLGTIAPGIIGTEPKLSPEDLDTDLEMCRDAGVEEVVIFRLGGLNKRYADVIKKFT